MAIKSVSAELTLPVMVLDVIRSMYEAPHLNDPARLVYIAKAVGANCTEVAGVLLQLVSDAKIRKVWEVEELTGNETYLYVPI